MNPLSRRGFIGCTLAASMLPVRAFAAPATLAAPAAGVNSKLFDRAMAAMSRHAASLAATDRIAIADFSKASAQARFHLIDFENGKVRSLLVAHGRGSDPKHSGWLQRFSNEPGSLATSDGAYLTGQGYVGEHGRSMRLTGLDPSNSTAADRAIVIHAAWYADASIARVQGKIGRSQGCFAVAPDALDPLLAWLGTGRLIYADRV